MGISRFNKRAGQQHKIPGNIPVFHDLIVTPIRVNVKKKPASFPAGPGIIREYTFLYHQAAGVLLMSPHHTAKKHPRDPQLHLGSSAGQDKERNKEGERHHPMDHPTPHAAHHPQEKPVLSPRHDAHSHPHGDDLPDHTNPPSTIRPSKKMTQTGKS